jgi:hypothetical protein
MHLAEEDEFISKLAQAEIKAALAKRPNGGVENRRSGFSLPVAIG